jgi:hypothetical protein
VNSSKRSDVPPPHFPELSGDAVIKYNDYNGRALIGEGEALFETKWSRSSGVDIIAYNDPPGIRGIALAKEAREPWDVTAATVADLNFSSRTRRPKEGQVVVIENTNGRFLSVKIVDVLSAGHGDPEDRLTIQFALVPSAADGAAGAQIIQLTTSIEAELQRFRPSEAVELPAHGGIGHNNPPEPTPLDAAEYNSAIEALRTVRSEVARDKPDQSKLTGSAETLQAIAWKIVSWTARKVDLAADEFAKQVGKSLGDGKILIAGWLAISGRIDQLIAMLGPWLGT